MRPVSLVLRRLSVLVPALLITLTACTDDLPTRTDDAATISRAAEPAARGIGSTEVRDIVSVPAFDLALSVSGDLTPGSAVRVEAVAGPNLPAPNAELALYLPELAIAQRTGPADFRVPQGVPLPSQARRALSLAEGQVGSLSSRHVVLHPGYYRAHAVALDTVTPELEFVEAAAGSFVQTEAHREVWLLVREGGGEVTEAFERDLIPEGMRPQPGPFRPSGVEPGLPGLTRSPDSEEDRRETRVASLGHRVLNFLRSTLRAVGARPTSVPGAAPAASSAPYEYQVVYFDDNSVMRPLPGALVEITHYPEFNGSLTDYENDTIETEAVTDSEGRFQVDCFTTYNNYTASVRVSDKFNILVQPTSVGSDNGNYDDCSNGTNLERQIISDSKPSHVYVNMKATMDSSRSLLGRSRGLLQVELDPNADNSFYSRSDDQVTIKSSDVDGHVFGSFGLFVAAHEYGHAVHEKALGGINDTSNCSEHEVPEPSSLSCALSEGFADYHAVATAGPDASWHFAISRRAFTKVEEYDGSQSYDPAEIEGAFAAFLFDVTDPAFNEEQSGSAHDSIAYPGNYVAGIIESCQADGAPASGTDHSVHCFEQAVRSEVLTHSNPEFFPARTFPPSSVGESASEPADWDLSELRSLWLVNIYDYEGPRPIGG